MTTSVVASARPAWRRFVLHAIGCLAAGLALILVLVSSPIRWDAKAFRSIWVESDVPLEPGTRVLFVSADNEWPAGHVSDYGLELVTFPGGDSKWIVPSEGYHAGSWTPDLVLDPDGTFTPMRERGGEAKPSIDRSTVILVSSPELEAVIAARWPESAAATVRTLAPPRASMIGGPRLLTGAQVGRLLLFGIVVGGCLIAAWLSSRGLRPMARVIAVAIALPAWVAIHTLLNFGLGKLHLPPAAGAFALEAVLLWSFVFRSLARPVVDRSESDARPSVSRVRVGLMCALGVLVLGQMGASIVRRDFDGDLLTHWLPAARSYYYVGDHDIGFLTSRFGVHHEATYPPAFPIMIASLMWVADADPARSLEPGVSTHVFVFLYRLVLALLCTAVLVGAGALVLCVAPDAWSVAIGFPLAIVLVVPLMSGRPNAGDVFLVPFVAAALLAWLAACLLRWRALVSVAVLLGLFTLMTKNDATVIWPLVLLPWLVLLPDRLHLRARDVALPAALVALPWLFWKSAMMKLGAGAHFAFEPFSWTGLLARQEILGSLYARAAQLLLSIPGWVPILLLLPASVVWLIATRRWRELPIPLGAGAYVALLPLICSFAQGERMGHLDVSFERIASSGFVSLLFFGLSVVLRSHAKAAGAATDPERRNEEPAPGTRVSETLAA